MRHLHLSPTEYDKLTRKESISLYESSMRDMKEERSYWTKFFVKLFGG